MDAMGLGLLGVAAARNEAESSRPWAPVVPDGREREPAARRRPARAAAPRRALASALRHLADAVAPDGAGHPAR